MVFNFLDRLFSPPREQIVELSDSQIKVIVRHRAYAKLRYYTKHVRIEWGGLLVVSTKGNEIIVEDVVFRPQRATSGDFHLDMNEMGKYLAKLADTNPSLLPKLKGWAHCLIPDEMVFTNQGILTAKEIYDKFKAGKKLYVPSLNHEKNKIEYKLIENIFKHTTPVLIKIETELKRQFTASPKHRLLVLNQSGTYSYMTMRDMVEGDFVAIPKGIPTIVDDKISTKIYIKNDKNIKYYPTLPSKMNKELARWLGMIFSDGHIRPRAIVEFSNNDKLLIDKYCKLSKKIFGLEPKINVRVTKGINQYRARLLSTTLYKYLKINLGFNKEHLPQIIFKTSKENVKEFIEGLIDGDGNVSVVKKGYSEKVVDICLGTKKNLAEELVYLLAILEIKARVKVIPQNWARRKSDYIYSTTFQEKPTSKSEIFPVGLLAHKYVLMGKLNPNKFGVTSKKVHISRDMLKKIVNMPKVQGMEDEYDIFKQLVKMPLNVVQINKIEKLGKKTEVYDIQVKDNHNFIAGHAPIISHNSHHSMGIFWSGEDNDTFKQLCDYYGDYVIGVVVDNKGNQLWRVDLKHKVFGRLIIDNIKPEYVITDPTIEQECIKDIKENLRRGIL